MANQLAQDIAIGVVDYLTSNRLFSAYQVSDEDCIIAWSSATEELIEARVQEVIDKGRNCCDK